MKKFGRSVHEGRFRFVFVAEQHAFILMVGKQFPLLLKCSVARNFAKITKSICLNFSIIILNYPVILSHRRSNTEFLET